MVSEPMAIIIAAGVTGVLTVSGTLGGSYLTYRQNKETTEMSIAAANKRKSAEYLLQKEADALATLLEKAERCHTLSQEYANAAKLQDDVSDNLIEETNDALAEFEAAVSTKGVFLNEEEMNAVSSHLGSVRRMLGYGDEHRRGRPDVAEEIGDWEDLINDFSDLKEVLREATKGRIDELREIDG